MARIERLCFYSFILLLIWLPIPLASHRPWAWSVVEVWIATQTLLLLFTHRHQFPWGRVRRFSWLLIPLTLFQCWVALQLMPISEYLLNSISPHAADIYRSIHAAEFSVSLDRYATFVSLLKGVSYTLFAFNAVLLINSLSRVQSVLYAIVISGTFQAFYAALEILLQVNTTWVLGMEQGLKANGTFVYHNHLANYLMMSLALGTGLIIAQLHQTPSGSWHVRLTRWSTALLSAKMMVRLCLVIMVIALVMTRSRMGNSAFFSVTIVAGVIALLFYKNRPRALTMFIVSLMLVDILIVGTLFGLEKVKDRLEATSIATETRDQAVEWSMNIIKDYPYTGTGMGSFYSTFPSYSQYNIGYYNFAHNDYVQFAVESGIPATLLLAFSVLYALKLCFISIRTRNSKTLKGTALGCLMAIVGMLIHISVDFNLQPPANALTFIIILVLAGCSSTLRVGKETKIS
jgi:O-antigen ligase